MELAEEIDMIQSLTLILVFLLVFDRMIHYAVTFNKKKALTSWKSFWYWVCFWKPIQARLRGKTPHFNDNEELYQKWRIQVSETIFNNPGINKLWDSGYYLRHKVNKSPEEEEELRKHEEIKKRIDQSRADFQLNWLKENHPKYYRLKRLRII